VTTAVGGAVRSGVPAENVQLNGTSGITHDPSGNLVFCEHYVVRRINSDGTIQTIAGTGTSGLSGDNGPAVRAQLSSPTSPQYDSKGNLYFLDSNGTRIRRVDPKGVITTLAGTGIYGTLGADGALVNAQIDLASSIAIAPDDSIYVAEYNDIRRITTQGTIAVMAQLSSCTSAAVCEPHSLALDASGNIYFASGQLYSGASPSSIYRLSPSGTVTQFAGFGTSTSGNGDGGAAMNAVFHGISALAFDSSGNMYVADSVEVSHEPSFVMTDPLITTVSVIRRIAASNGTVTTIAGQANAPSPYEGPALHAYLGLLSGLATNTDGSVSFSSANTVGELTTQATIQLLAGRNFQPPPDGLSAAAAWFSLPISVQSAASRSGNFYFADHCTIRKVDASGILSTVAGTGNCASSVPMMFGPGVDLPPVYALAADSHDKVFAVFESGLYSLASDGTIAEIPGFELTVSMAIAVDSQDRLYIVPWMSDVFRLDTDGSVEELHWTSQLQAGTPISAFSSAISIDPYDNVYVLTASPVNCCNYAVYRFAPNGVGSPIVGLSRFLFPITYTVDGLGGIWFTGIYPLALQYVSPSTLPSVMTVCCGYSGDGGPVVAADFYLTSGSSVANDASGNIYVLDAGNAVIRKISGAPPAQAPVVSSGGIVNAASLLGGAIAPGELISIFGSNFLSSGLEVNAAENNSVPTTLSNLRVSIAGNQGGADGAITAATPNQINVFVPYEIAGNTSVTINVSADYLGSTSVTVPVAQSAFGLSTADASGSGQGAILNQDGSYNGDKNPASAGSVVSLFGTGEGLTTPALPDGALVISTPYSIPNATVTVTIGGQPAQVLYAGAAPFLPTGVLQINAQIPIGVSGDAPVLVNVGGIATSRKVTVAVK
jgi:uncharacterized protein (TIGR03437 family)